VTSIPDNAASSFAKAMTVRSLECAVDGANRVCVPGVVQRR
jgi:hypothetical protein